MDSCAPADPCLVDNDPADLLVDGGSADLLEEASQQAGILESPSLHVNQEAVLERLLDLAEAFASLGQRTSAPPDNEPASSATMSSCVEATELKDALNRLGRNFPMDVAAVRSCIAAFDLQCATEAGQHALCASGAVHALVRSMGEFAAPEAELSCGSLVRLVRAARGARVAACEAGGELVLRKLIDQWPLHDGVQERAHTLLCGLALKRPDDPSLWTAPATWADSLGREQEEPDDALAALSEAMSLQQLSPPCAHAQSEPSQPPLLSELLGLGGGTVLEDEI